MIYPYSVYHLRDKASLSPDHAKIVNDIVFRRTKDDNGLKRLSEACKRLFDEGAYIKAADINAKDIQEAKLATQSAYLSQWSLKQTNKLVPTLNSIRDTSSKDIVQSFDDLYLLMPIGYVDLSTGEYVRRQI